MSDEALKLRFNQAVDSGEWVQFDRNDVIPAAWIRSVALAEHGHPKGLRIIGATIQGNLDFEDCTIPRPVGLVECIIAGNINLHRANGNVLGFFSCPLIGSIGANRLELSRSLFLHKSTIRGALKLIGARVGGDLRLNGATLDGGLDADRLEVRGGLFLCDGFSANGRVSLDHAKIEILNDDAAGWSNLILSGLIYGSFGHESPHTAEERLQWLGRRQNTEKFDPQPYEQLAKVLKESGHNGGARRILIEKERDYARRMRQAARTEFQWLHVIWLGLMDKLTRHGYEPWRVLPHILIVWALGWGIFAFADLHDAMVPAKERVYLDEKYKDGSLPPQYPRFNAFIYSADVFFPFVDLHQESEWRPATEKVNGRQTGVHVLTGVIAKVYTWIHIILGWFLSGIGVAAVTGLVKRD